MLLGNLGFLSQSQIHIILNAGFAHSFSQFWLGSLHAPGNVSGTEDSIGNKTDQVLTVMMRNTLLGVRGPDRI